MNYESKDIIMDITYFEPKRISYLYRGNSAVSNNVFKFAETCRYQCLLTMKRGINHYQSNNILSLSRIDSNDIHKWI